MIFILLLIAATTAIAGAAAYFSVYGLAYTFSGVFWSVVVMGASLEAGKLVAASFLYRYWTRTNLILKSYLIAGVAALMLLTSLGIFGYLSAGYQQDVLPLKQKQEQVRLLEEEKERVLTRKRQIDDILAGGPAVTNVNRKDGSVDANATRALRETTRSRESLVRQYKSEQEGVTKRVAELDAQLLTLKQDLIKTEAHIGPITYIAKAFDLDSDNATKYLIFVIIFAFDPMAVALTLAVNVALRLRREDQEQEAAETKVVAPELPAVEPAADPVVADLDPAPAPIVEKIAVEDQRGSLDEVDFSPQHKIAVEDQRGSLDEVDFSPDPAPEPEQLTAEPVAEPAVEPVVEPVAEPAVEPVPQPPSEEAMRLRYGPRWRGSVDTTPDKLRELINHHRYIKAKKDVGDKLTPEEAWELEATAEILRKNGVNMYL